MEPLQHLIDTCRTFHPTASVDCIRDAYAFARTAHGDQRRLSGALYVSHATAVGATLASWGMPPKVIAAGILHDVPEDANIPLEEIERRFGREIAGLVEGETKLSKLRFQGRERFAENWRKMFVAMANDTRVIVVKFADRADNLKSLDVFPVEKQRRIALETLEIYSPIANRFGMRRILGELEDLAFPYVYPTEAAWVDSLVATHEAHRRTLCAVLQDEAREALTTAGVPVVAVHGRMKYRYRLYQKLLRHNHDITKIYDLVGLRVVLQTAEDCYAALSTIHRHWQPVQGRMKDYITEPKSNGYRAIHTTVDVGGGDIVEFHVLTEEMHEVNEWGAASSWRYHERGAHRLSTDQVRWVEELIAWVRSVSDTEEFLAELKLDILRHRIFVFTPKGDAIELPEAATPLDLAYAIHSAIGNRAIGARVNGNTRLHPLDAPLKSGDLVEIITDPKRKGPSPDWLHVVKTTLARSKIKDALRGRERTTAAALRGAHAPMKR